VPKSPSPNTELTNLALRYVRERIARGELTKETGEQYLSRLLSFTTTTKAKSPRDVMRRHVLKWMERGGLSTHYRRSRLSVLRGFTEWCVLERKMDRDPCAGIKLPKLPPLLPRYLTQDESEAAVAAASDARARLACILMLQLGLRRGEVQRIQLGDIDRRKRVLGVRGKGGRGQITRRMPLVDEAWFALVAYMPSVPGSSGPLFRSTRWPDRPISGAWIGDLVTRALYDAGVKHYAWDGRSPHALRHTFAQDLADNDAPPDVIQEGMGHASIQTTMDLYVRGRAHANGKLREAMEGRRYAAPVELAAAV
jgi:integrase/recombinase XerD